MRPRLPTPIMRERWLDVAGPLLIAGFAALLLLPRASALPLQLWDESRNAVNALEMARHGLWLTPTFAGAVDHWNTKPPLMIWAMAAGLWAGLPPLLAIRLPSMLAATASALMIWGVCRYGLRDRMAGLAGAALLLGAGLYVGWHGASTGDYDAPEAAFLLAYVLAGWAALESGRARFAVLACVALALGVLTKGVAATLALPGLGLYALSRPRALAALVRRPPTWIGAGVVVVLVGGYYAGREALDPGYLAAVAHNELGGRFLQVTEHHRGGPLFYVALLARQAEPCAAAALCVVATFVAKPSPRRRLAQAVLAALASLLVVLSLSHSKMEWYAVAMVPPLALLAGLGLSDVARAALGPTAQAAARAGLGLLLAAGVLGALRQVWTAPARLDRSAIGPQHRYGRLISDLYAQGWRGRVVAVDGGFYNDAGFADYNPMLRFYATLYAPRGLDVVQVAPESARAPGERIISCDPSAIADLRDRYVLSHAAVLDGCLVARILAAS